MGVINEAFPANGGARFFKVNTHYNEKVSGETPARFFQAGRVFDGGSWIVNGAGADNNHKAIIIPLEDVFAVFAGSSNDLRGAF